MTDQRPLPPYVGCTDGGCVFGHPGGMHTNGGCKCLDELRELYGPGPDGLYARVRSGLLRLRMRLERAEAEAQRAMLFLASANRHLPYVQGDDWPKALHNEINRYLAGPS